MADVSQIITIKTYEQKSILRVGLIQQANNGNIADNRSRLCEKMRRLAADGARLIVNQELHDSLYFCRTESTDMCNACRGYPSDVTETYSALAAGLGVVIVTSLLERRPPGLYPALRLLGLTAVWRACTARCIYPTIRHIAKFYFTQATLDSNLSTLR